MKINEINHDQTPLTFNELFDEYCLLYKNTLSEKTYQTKIYYYNKHFKDKYGHNIITDFKFKDAQLFVLCIRGQDFTFLLKNIIIFKTIKG